MLSVISWRPKQGVRNAGIRPLKFTAWKNNDENGTKLWHEEAVGLCLGIREQAHAEQIFPAAPPKKCINKSNRQDEKGLCHRGERKNASN